VNPYTNDVAGDLLPRGEEEHYLLAKRFKERFPSIFNRFDEAKERRKSKID
jgi:hypothetical protein